MTTMAPRTDRFPVASDAGTGSRGSRPVESGPMESGDVVPLDTLRGPVLGLSDTSALLPGHGPQSLMAAERSSNPYLQADYLGGIR